MSFLLLLGLAASTPIQQPLQNCQGNPTLRAAKSSDLVVVCGQQSVTLSILLCPVYYSGYNEMMLAMNSVFTDPDCYGEAHWNLSIPVLHFHFPITDDIIGKCGNVFQVLDEEFEGIFQETSPQQTMSVRGAILSQESADSMVTYTQGLFYQYSCNYPLLYLISDTQISVDGLSVAMRDNQGRFISTLGLELYSHSYQSRLLIPHYGIPLNTTIFVAVMAFNLSSRFHLFLERCYASTSKILGNGSTYNLFDGCVKNEKTSILVNGEAPYAHFSFQAFRFIEHSDLPLSTFYLQCAARICEISVCPSLPAQICSTAQSRRRRKAHGPEMRDTNSSPTTVTSVPIITRTRNNILSVASGQSACPPRNYPQIVAALRAGMGILAFSCVGAAAFLIGWPFLRKRTKGKMEDDPQ
ncbi:zona pellucida-like domain-containing protein 1 isoform X2 [Scyliorhinus torazame]|uniref:zona pellucida-like domain-containing protein 1 isoform X2 n=1 Tax=Scyliorhinus torazame TaxID=75743 RepID=UPI003B5CCD2A